MRVEVLLSSGETDGWNSVDDAQVNDGHLMILSEIEGDEIPGWMKTITEKTEVEEYPLGVYRSPHVVTKHKTFQLNALYAPGMWMKVVYLEG